MPTIEELQAQINALQQQMAALTTPPDTYYTSIWSGEEIDAAIQQVKSGLVGGVASFNGRTGAVMPQTGDYNATQIPVSAGDDAESVAAALNNKAPAGYGLGGNMVNAPSNGDGFPDTDLITGTGFYKAFNNVPFSGWNYVMEVQYSENADETQYAWDLDDLYYLAIRKKRSGVWSPWEYANPPLLLGVEYRTTERHNRKPVYKKHVNTGALSAGTFKSVAHGVQDIGLRLSALYGVDNGGSNLVSNPGITGILVDGSNITITTAAGFSTSNSWVVITYTKTTD